MEQYIEFINSKAVREHLTRIKFNLSPLEAAYVVEKNKNLTIKEKHKLWNEIISATPDEDLPKEHGLTVGTLHEFLKRYMEIQDMLCERFLKYEKDAVYTCSSGVVTLPDGNRLISSPFYWCNIYTSLDLCVQDARLKGHCTYDIRKHYLKIKAEDADYKSIWADLASDGEIKNIGSVFALGEADEKISVFLNLYQALRIPHPFKKGDVVFYEDSNSLWCEKLVVKKCKGELVFVSETLENDKEFYLPGCCLDSVEINV